MRKQCRVFLPHEAIFDISDTEFRIFEKFGYEESNRYHDRIKCELQKLTFEAESHMSSGYMYRGFIIYFMPFSPATIFWIIENGDNNMPLPLKDHRMTSEEFYAYTGEERCELIDGYLYDMAAPTRIHQAVQGELYSIIKDHIREKNCDCLIYPAPFNVQLSTDNDTVLEPDISVICDRSKLTERGCLGAPDWIIEVASPTSIARDYIEKLKLYAAAKVREYWIVNPSDQSVTVYNLSRTSVADSYRFGDVVSADICEGFVIDFNLVIEMMKNENLI